ncbi:MAG: signal peptidase II [Alphaproteobacteria bacterium]
MISPLGPRTAWGLGWALGVFGLDRANKIWLVEIYNLGDRGRVEITSYFDLVMVWNRGVSYGFFQQDSATGRYVLAGMALLIALILVFWLARTHTRLAASALGLLIGGAVANAVDRFTYGAVADFYSLHLAGFYWYVFNLADVAIVAGVIGLLYRSSGGDHKSA